VHSIIGAWQNRHGEGVAMTVGGGGELLVSMESGNEAPRAHAAAA
jgi:hypothetical protein